MALGMCVFSVSHLDSMSPDQRNEAYRWIPAYEQPLPLPNGRIRYPDFTITDPARGVTFFWEHLGMLDDRGYKERWQRKLTEYLEAGIRPHEDGGGPAGTLLITRDEENGGIDSAKIAKLIEDLLN
jgi:hypothetical protein